MNDKIKEAYNKYTPGKIFLLKVDIAALPMLTSSTSIGALHNQLENWTRLPKGTICLLLSVSEEYIFAAKMAKFVFLVGEQNKVFKAVFAENAVSSIIGFIYK